MRILKFCTISFICLMSLQGAAQIATEAQCRATLRARAPLRINGIQVEKVCEENALEVVNCALTEFQAAPFSGDFKKSLRHCRLEYSVLGNL